MDTPARRIVLNGTALTVAELIALVDGEGVPVVDPAARERAVRSWHTGLRLAAAGRLYGRGTGVGAHRGIAVDDGDEAAHGLRLLRSHAGGAGALLPARQVRAMLAVRVNQLLAGGSGIHPDFVDALAEALRLGVHPAVNEYGGVGTGDLTALAQTGLTLLGERPWLLSDGDRPAVAPLPGPPASAPPVVAVLPASPDGAGPGSGVPVVVAAAPPGGPSRGTPGAGGPPRGASGPGDLPRGTAAAPPSGPARTASAAGDVSRTASGLGDVSRTASGPGDLSRLSAMPPGVSPRTGPAHPPDTVAAPGAGRPVPTGVPETAPIPLAGIPAPAAPPLSAIPSPAAPPEAGASRTGPGASSTRGGVSAGPAPDADRARSAIRPAGPGAPAAPPGAGPSPGGPSAPGSGRVGDGTRPSTSPANGSRSAAPRGILPSVAPPGTSVPAAPPGGHASHTGPGAPSVLGSVSAGERPGPVVAPPAGASAAAAAPTGAPPSGASAGAVPPAGPTGTPAPTAPSEARPAEPWGVPREGAAPVGQELPRPVTLRAGDALALLSSNALGLGQAALAGFRLAQLLRAAHAVAALSLAAVSGAAEAYAAPVHALRPYRGAARAAGEVRRLLGLPDRPAVPGRRIQDPFGFRAFPQVHGCALDAADRLREVVEVEINCPSENPLMDPGGTAAYHHGGFFAAPLGLALEAANLALLQTAQLSAARLTALGDPALTGLTAFLATGPASSSGTMILEYTSHSALAEVRAGAAPASTGHAVLSHGLEEAASFAGQSARQTLRATEAYVTVLACELVAAVRALRMHPVRPDVPAFTVAAAALPDGTEDRPLTGDVLAAAELLPVLAEL